MVKINKNKANNKLFKYFKHLPLNSRFIYFNNPKDFSSFNIEYVNPTHVGIIRGLRKRKLRKTKGNAYIKVAKVYLSQFALWFIDLYDKSVLLFNTIIENLGIVMCCYYIFIGIFVIMLLYNIPVIEVFVLTLKRS